MKSDQRMRGMIGMAMRAGRVIIGTELVCRAMPRGEIRLVVISSAASQPTKKKLSVKSEFYGIDWIEAGIDTEDLGALLGKTGAVAGIAITDPGLSEQIKKACLGN